MQQREVDELDALTGVDDHLEFAAKAIAQPFVPDAVRVEIQQSIEHIQQRRRDPNLYLAVIGEFSSGKRFV